MSPRIRRPAIGHWRGMKVPISSSNRQICLICSRSSDLRHYRRSNLEQQLQNRGTRARPQSNLANAEVKGTDIRARTGDSRMLLRDALLDLQQHAGGFVNLSRVQLAVRGLGQSEGHEAIRIAILGLSDGGASLRKAKELLRLLVADPLQTEQEWENVLTDDEHSSKPFLIRVGYHGVDDFGPGNTLIQELHVSSPTLKGHNLELLVMEMDPPPRGDTFTDDQYANTVLVPSMDIPTSKIGRYTKVTTPVHKSLIVADGLLGAARLLSYPIDINPDIFGTAVNLKLANSDDRSSFSFQVVDTVLGTAALNSFRESVSNALAYEHDWFASGLPVTLQWLKSGTAASSAAMKPLLRQLIDSLLKDTKFAIQKEKARQQKTALLNQASSLDLDSLQDGLLQWAERAHAELRDELETAFHGQRWRKLGWWKLFWRVDDVSMISSDILNQRFLTNAEKEIIFLAGRIEEAGAFRDIPSTPEGHWAYKPSAEGAVDASLGSLPPPPRIQDLIEKREDLLVKIRAQPWPLHIPATRSFLSLDTVPALQALAQTLVMQTLTTSSLSTVFAGLIYVSTLSTGLYEAGAVAMLGIVWSLRRMQGKWETARRFWEGEVREEGRKAIRSVESVVGNVLSKSHAAPEGDEEFEIAQKTVERAEAALIACK